MTLRVCDFRSLGRRGVLGRAANIIGTWKLPLSGGFWVLEVHRDGTYKFHSEASDGAPPSEGSFGARSGRWSLAATTGYRDSDTCHLQSADVWIATGQHGTAGWQRQTQETASSKQ